ncbi:hypothetical protein DFQ28_005671 [Apophysomyces sp. BC1034]|nr:hypothetical protein DFQ30_006470 [Apophysomyces sp. BC1015]KAG0176925.1 hypothetical protein DFQ29_005459 [Apophysomyces sp. BC1021]KAG0187921.1 hypothetical protein DFQ28_005671 [Apophysomyces sp. BC1034]
MSNNIFTPANERPVDRMNVEGEVEEVGAEAQTKNLPAQSVTPPVLSAQQMALQSYHNVQAQTTDLENQHFLLVNNKAPLEEQVTGLKAMQMAQQYQQEYRKFCKERYPQCPEFYTWEELGAKQETRDRSKVPEHRSSSADRFIPHDLPVLQIIGEPKWHPSKVVHLSAELFLRAFEKELHASNLPMEQYWGRIFPKCLNDAQTIWFDNELKNSPTISWLEMCKKVKARFDTPEQKMCAMEAVLHMRQKKGEKTQPYVRRFQQRCIEAGLAEYNVPIIIALLASLEKKNMAYNLVLTKFGSDFVDQSVDDICQYVAGLQLDDTDQNKPNPCTMVTPVTNTTKTKRANNLHSPRYSDPHVASLPTIAILVK